MNFQAMVKPVAQLVIVLGLVLAAGCAGRRAGEPIVDMKGVNANQYQQDLQECGAYADDVKVGRQAAGGAVVGAAVGAAVGAVVGNSDTAKRGAGVGAIGGGVRGAGRGLVERNRVVKNCLSGRGYRVLN